MFEKVHEQKAGNGMNPTSIEQNGITGEIYARIDKFKLVASTKGTYAIVEMTPVHLIEGASENKFQLDKAYSSMSCKYDEHNGMLEKFVTEYVAACNCVAVGHAFSEDKEVNKAQWKGLCEAGFGKQGYDEKAGKIVFTCGNPHQGVVLHIKSTLDDQMWKDVAKRSLDKDTKEVRVFTNAKVIQLVQDLPADVIEKFGKTLSPSYGL